MLCLLAVSMPSSRVYLGLNEREHIPRPLYILTSPSPPLLLEFLLVLTEV